MVIMWSFYLLNSINGFRVWLRLSRQPSEDGSGVLTGAVDN
jgi:hypothetical protein